MGNGALPNGPSYRAYPRLYLNISAFRSDFRRQATKRVNRRRMTHGVQKCASIPELDLAARDMVPTVLESNDGC
jgi:hypothetical protein